MKLTIVGLNNSKNLAREIHRVVRSALVQLKVKHFPDGELYIKYSSPTLSGHVVLIQTLHPFPNEAILETIFAGKTARELGAQKLTLVAPYLAYLRQDKRFKPGECVSNKILAGLLDFFDCIITIDPHLHRVKALKEIFKTNAYHLTANHLIAEFIAKKYPESVLIGPDSESSQWAATIAKKIKHPFVILKKKRYSARTVRIKIHTPDIVRNKTVILVDDMISTGSTMLEPIKQLKNFGAKKIVCICVHGIFAEHALEKLKKAGAIVHATNTIQNPLATINVAKIIAKELS